MIDEMTPAALFLLWELWDVALALAQTPLSIVHTVFSYVF